jgi:hypothetical protein
MALTRDLLRDRSAPALGRQLERARVMLLPAMGQSPFDHPGGLAALEMR